MVCALWTTCTHTNADAQHGSMESYIFSDTIEIECLLFCLCLCHCNPRGMESNIVCCLIHKPAETQLLHNHSLCYTLH